MRELVLLGVAAACFAGAAFLPGTSADIDTEPTAKAAGAVPSPVDEGPAAQSNAAWNAGEFEISRGSNGHFYAVADVNGQPLRFMVDTGASTVALTGDDARTLGLYWSEGDIRPVAQGANGPVYGVNVVLDRVDIGGFSATNVSAMIVPEGLGVSLLGQSYLSTVPSVRIEGETMLLGG